MGTLARPDFERSGERSETSLQVAEMMHVDCNRPIDLTSDAGVDFWEFAASGRTCPMQAMRRSGLISR